MVAPPSKAIFAVGLPCSRESFIAQARAGEPRRIVDMLRRQRQDSRQPWDPLVCWYTFYDQQVQLIEKAAKCAKQAGFEVFYEARRRDFRGFVGANLVVLVTHIDDGHMEFADEMVTTEQLLALIDPHYEGVADFIGCESDAMVRGLKFQRPRADYMMTVTKAWNLDEQLFIFRHTLEFMQVTGLDYLTAKMTLRTKLLERLRAQQEPDDEDPDTGMRS
jgi:hypothetical protein